MVVKTEQEIFVVSDGTGRTADMALQSALTQFSFQHINTHIRPNVRSVEQVEEIIEEAKEAGALILHTIVSSGLRTKLLDLGRLNNVETHDLMGPLLAQLSLHLNTTPAQHPGLFNEINKAYFQRIEALEYAFKHDDGQREHELDKAEIVLIGVSRTFKTPLSIYFAFKGWMASNVPIIYNMDPPDILLELPAEKVFALSTTPARLSALRQVRHEYLGGATGDYATLDHVKEELNFAHQYYRRQPRWPVIDVTNKPIEEIANEILAIIKRREE